MYLTFWKRIKLNCKFTKELTLHIKWTCLIMIHYCFTAYFQYHSCFVVVVKSFEMERGSLNAPNANSVKDKGKSEDLKGKASCSAEVIIDQCVDVMFICSEWGSSKGGLSTFNRELAVNLAKYWKERIRVHCFVCQST